MRTVRMAANTCWLPTWQAKSRCEQSFTFRTFGAEVARAMILESFVISVCFFGSVSYPSFSEEHNTERSRPMNFLTSSPVALYAALAVMAIVCYYATLSGRNHITGAGKYD